MNDDDEYTDDNDDDTDKNDEDTDDNDDDTDDNDDGSDDNDDDTDDTEGDNRVEVAVQEPRAMESRFLSARQPKYSYLVSHCQCHCHKNTCPKIIPGESVTGVRGGLKVLSMAWQYSFRTI